MIEHKGKEYYSLTEVANAFNRNEEKFRELKTKFCEVYRKTVDTYFTDVYIQSKFYTAKNLGEVKFIKYRKENKKKIYYSFNIDDMLEFLNKPCARNIQQSKYIVIED